MSCINVYSNFILPTVLSYVVVFDFDVHRNLSNVLAIIHNDALFYSDWFWRHWYRTILLILPESLESFFLSSSTIVIEFLWRNRASRTYWKRMSFCAKVARSFTSIVNRIGPNIEPCGTPKDTNCLVDMFSWLDWLFFSE